MWFQPNSNSRLTSSIILLVNTCLLLFISWLVIKVGLVSSAVAIWIISFVILSWLFLSRWINTINIGYIVILGVILRLIWCFTVYTQPYGDFYGYWLGAEKMLSNIIPFQTKSPLTVIFYGIVTYICNKQIWGIYIANSLLGGLQIWLVYKISANITSDRFSSRMAAILYALYPVAITFSAIVSSEASMMTLLLLAVYLLCKKFCLDYSSDNTNVYGMKNFLLIMLISLCLAGAYLARNTAGLMLGLFILSIPLFSTKRLAGRFLDVLILVLFFFVFMSPQIASNYHYYKKFSLESQHLSGIVLLNGVSRRTSGVIDPEKFKQVLTELGYSNDDLKHSKAAVDAVSQRARQMAINDIMSDKIGFLKFALTDKFRKMWGNENYSFFITYKSKIFDEEKNQIAMKKIDHLSTQYYLALWILALFSILFAYFKKNIMISIMSGYILLTFLLHIFFEVSARYHLPVMPYVCIMASYCFSQGYISELSFKKKWQYIQIFVSNLLRLRKSESATN